MPDERDPASAEPTASAECGAAPPAPAPASEGEPATHCEWCGAEYPVPGAS